MNPYERQWISYKETTTDRHFSCRLETYEEMRDRLTHMNLEPGIVNRALTKAFEGINPCSEIEICQNLYPSRWRKITQ